MTVSQKADNWSRNPIWRLATQVVGIIMAAAMIGMFTWVKGLEKGAGETDRKVAILDQQMKMRERDSAGNADAIRLLTARLLDSDKSMARVETQISGLAQSQLRIESMLSAIMRDQRAENSLGRPQRP